MSGTPAYVRIADDLRAKIRSGELADGAQLPSMSQLRDAYGVSSTVIRSVLAELRNEGLVVGQQGKGVFVRAGAAGRVAAPPDAGALLRRLDELTETVRAMDSRLRVLEQTGVKGSGAS
ncbi:GntR family transcriptional regulator [Streptosporangium sandarakinum]